MRYVVSDLHLTHANIIEYCDRPYSDVEEMNRQLVDNWNRTVSPDDTVVFLGDLTMGADHDEAVEWAERLNGSVVFVEGNHDELDAERAPFPVVESCVISHGKYRFGCAHRPEDTPEDGEWGLYGHHHNNFPRDYPFIDGRNNRVNVSVELIGYAPLSLDALCGLLDAHDWLGELGDAAVHGVPE